MQDTRILMELYIKQQEAQGRVEHYLEQLRENVAIIQKAQKEIARAVKKGNVMASQLEDFQDKLSEIQEFMEEVQDSEKEEGGKVLKFLDYRKAA